MDTSLLNDIKMISEQIRFNSPMKDHTSFRIGGPADVLIFPNNIEDVKNIVAYAKNKDIPYYIIGNGSNILVSDKGIRGIVIKICRVMNRIEVCDDTISVEAGALLPSISNVAMKHGLSGIEHVVGIPGTLGGGIMMNAGSCGQELGDVIEKVTILTHDGEIKEIDKKQIRFGYRYVSFQETKDIMLGAVLKLQKKEIEEIEEKMHSILKKRKEKFPLSYPNAGSIFKRKGDYFPGKLIEDAGCKKMARGNAEVSQLHANFIINKGNATANDILYLMKDVQEIVFSKFGVLLEPEIIFLGE